MRTFTENKSQKGIFSKSSLILIIGQTSKNTTMTKTASMTHIVTFRALQMNRIILLLLVNNGRRLMVRFLI
jgi:hypothetical protein